MHHFSDDPAALMLEGDPSVTKDICIAARLVVNGATLHSLYLRERGLLLRAAEHNGRSDRTSVGFARGAVVTKGVIASRVCMTCGSDKKQVY